jgi:Common central domain of tyrosinase/Polyphenol oxidase middle domain
MGMTNCLSRRRLLKNAGVAASVVILGQSLAGCVTVPATPVVRRDVGGMSASDPVIVSYGKAIKAMKALPASDPRSWTYQAAIHGTTLSPPNTAWNTCEHGTYFFWSWHRMYLYWFERIIRKMSGDYDWALPYWNWSAPSERQLPSMFRDATSELFVADRNPAMNDGTGSLPAWDVDYGPAFLLTNFASASSSLEGTPHGAVHVDVGGLMGWVPTAAQDPIFYLHHCNIDRLWNLWLAQGGGRADPLGDATWRNTKFTFFNEKGTQVHMTGCDVLRAAEQLKYTYEGEPPQVKSYCLEIAKLPVFARELVFRLPIPPVELGAEATTVQVDLREVRQQLADIAESATDTLFLELDDVGADRPPGVVWEVYLGAPPGKLERDPKSPYFIGNVALFGTGIRDEGHHEFKPAHFAFPIAGALRAVLKTNLRRVPITFVAHGVLVNGALTRPKVNAPVRIGTISITVERVKEQ